jgi:5-methylcytosine-specific restriction endonuclease McrA
MKRDKYDATFSDYIRARDRWTCQRCKRYFPEGQRNGVHCSHFIGRRKQGTRFEPDNADALCHGCHQQMEDLKGTEYRDWKMLQLGEQRFYEMQRQGTAVKKWKAGEKDELRDYYLDQLDKLNQ